MSCVVVHLRLYLPNFQTCWPDDFYYVLIHETVEFKENVQYFLFHLTVYVPVCCCLVVRLCPTLHDPMDQSMPGPPVFHCLPEFCSKSLVALMTLSNHLVLRRPLLLLPSHFPNIRVFSRESSLLMRWPKYWNLIVQRAKWVEGAWEIQKPNAQMSTCTHQHCRPSQEDF